jgi:hypothetical protein
MRFTIIDDINFETYAMRVYDNPACAGVEEFQEDLNDPPKYIKRLLRKFHNGGELRERLIANHLIRFFNVFGVEPATKLLLYKLEPPLYPYLKSFLIYLKYYKPSVHNGPHRLNMVDRDEDILTRLKQTLGDPQ